MIDYEEKRKVLAKLLRELSPYEGKYIRKLGENSISEIRESLAQADGHILPQEIQTSDNKKIDLSGLRESIGQVESRINALDQLESCPALDECREAIETLIAAQNRLREESGIPNAEFQANRLGLLRAYLQNNGW